MQTRRPAGITDVSYIENIQIDSRTAVELVSVFREEVFSQLWQVTTSITERRQVYSSDVESIIEILPQLSFLHRLS